MLAENQSNIISNGIKKVPPGSPQMPPISGYLPHWSGTRWNGISLEYHRQPPGETSEYALGHHAISINLGQGFKLERIYEGRRKAEWMYTGMVGLCPLHIPRAIRWNKEASILFINLEQALLIRNAVELLETDRFELTPYLAIQDPFIQQIGLALEADLKSNGSCDGIYGETLANALAMHLLKRFSIQRGNGRVYLGGLPPQKLRLVTDYIQYYLLERELSLDELAALVQLSPYHFCRAFKKSTGLSPHQYVLQQRIGQAKHLLKQGKMPICEVAIACGFTDQSHLSRYFKRLTGVTPKTFLQS